MATLGALALQHTQAVAGRDHPATKAARRFARDGRDASYNRFLRACEADLTEAQRWELTDRLNRVGLHMWSEAECMAYGARVASIASRYLGADHPVTHRAQQTANDGDANALDRALVDVEAGASRALPFKWATENKGPRILQGHKGVKH